MRRWPGWVTNVDFGRLSFVRFSPVANKQRHRGRAEGPRACIGPTDAVTSNSRGRLKLAKKSPSIDHGWRATWLNKCPLRFWAYSFTDSVSPTGSGSGPFNILSNSNSQRARKNGGWRPTVRNRPRYYWSPGKLSVIRSAKCCTSNWMKSWLRIYWATRKTNSRYGADGNAGADESGSRCGCG